MIKAYYMGKLSILETIKLNRPTFTKKRSVAYKRNRRAYYNCY
jgi:hypothetical protein